MFVDSVKEFKDMYYLVSPDRDMAYSYVMRLVTNTDNEGRTILDDNGKVRTRMVSLLPFRWWKGHFTNSPRDYSFEDEELDDQDRVLYATLCRYMKGFSLVQWVKRSGALVVDEEGEFVWEARAINTRALLGYKTFEKS